MLSRDVNRANAIDWYITAQRCTGGICRSLRIVGEAVSLRMNISRIGANC